MRVGGRGCGGGGLFGCSAGQQDAASKVVTARGAMGAGDEKKKQSSLFSWLRITPTTVIGTLSFLTVALLLLQENSYRKRLEHEKAVDRGICEAQVGAVFLAFHKSWFDVFCRVHARMR